MKLSELQKRLEYLMGDALRRQDEDPHVFLVDRYGARVDIGELRLDWVPETLDEAETGERHPVVEVISKEWE